MNWRYLTADGVDAAAGLAFDEAIMLRYGRTEVPPAPATVRLYTYRAHCALVGRHQSLEDEIDLEACRDAGAQVGRRPTGGGAILMGPAQLGVAIAARAVAEQTPRQALQRYAAGVVAGLAGLGIEARFRAKNDLEVGGRKIAGLGLYLDPRGAMLFHASVLVDLDVPLMLRLLRIPGAKLADKAVAGVAERVTTVSRELLTGEWPVAGVSQGALRERCPDPVQGEGSRREAQRSRAPVAGSPASARRPQGTPAFGRGAGPLVAADVRDAFAAGMARAFAVSFKRGKLDAGERAHFAELTDRYASKIWIHQRSPRRDARGSALLKTPEGLLRIFAAVDGETIKSVLVAGDFNALPPGLGRLEAALRWSRAERGRIEAAAAETLGADELGVPPAAVAGALWEAVAGALDRQRQAHPSRTGGSCYFPDRDGVPDGARPHPERSQKEAR